MRLRMRIGEICPIMPGSERSPGNWRGWPGGQKFAFVLAHDIESRAGLDNCRSVMQLEMELGFRSSFNFVPEGDYLVPADGRNSLAADSKLGYTISNMMAISLPRIGVQTAGGKN
jgi:hypothetical protein